MAPVAVKQSLASVETLADMLDRLGDVPLERIRFHPFPGTATERDVVRAHAAPARRLCELIDGTLVEKAVGTKEAMLGSLVVHHFWSYLDENNIGVALGGDGLLRLWAGRVRIPDACFISWESIPGGELPDEPIAHLIPDLIVEVLSKSNTAKEIANKLSDFFKMGTRLAWVINPKTATADVYTSPTERKRLGKTGALDGGDVLPGFSLPLSKLFAKRTLRKPKS